MTVLVDSTGWIEFFTGGPLAERYASYFSPRYQIITPTIVLPGIVYVRERETRRKLRDER